MDILKKIVYALWQQNIEILADPHVIYTIYLLVFIILFLENSLLFTAFLPGDSLLLLVGALISKNILNFYLTLLLLTIASSLGSCIGYLQGRWLRNNPVIKKWMEYLPPYYHNMAYTMFYKYGFSSLLIGRFIVFVRTLLPMMAGLSLINHLRFQFFNWISACLWIFILIKSGYFLGNMAIFQRYEEKFMICLILLPLILLFLGFCSVMILIFRRNKNIL